MKHIIWTDETKPADGDDMTWNNMPGAEHVSVRVCTPVIHDGVIDYGQYDEPAAPTLEERLAQVERTLAELGAKVAQWEGDS